MKKSNLNTPTGKQDEKSGRDSGGRWKPGQSGNPAGRPPKDATWAALLGIMKMIKNMSDKHR